MMTQSIFVRLADMFAGELTIAGCRVDPAIRDAQRTAIRNVILSTADLCKQDNARFNRERFYAACGLTKEGAFK